jgi:hypothetical protein
MAFSRLQVTSCHYTGRYVVSLHHDEQTTATAVREAASRQSGTEYSGMCFSGLSAQEAMSCASSTTPLVSM